MFTFCSRHLCLLQLHKRLKRLKERKIASDKNCAPFPIDHVVIYVDQASVTPTTQWLSIFSHKDNDVVVLALTWGVCLCNCVRASAFFCGSILSELVTWWGVLTHTPTSGRDNAVCVHTDVSVSYLISISWPNESWVQSCRISGIIQNYKHLSTLHSFH